MHSPDANEHVPERKIEFILLAINSITEQQLEEALEV